MTSYADIQKIRNFEKKVADLGFEICDGTSWSKHGPYSGTSFIIDEMHNGSHLGLRPVDNRYPAYTRGAVVFTGSMEEAQHFLHGIQFAYNTDKAIGVSNEKKRSQAEFKYSEKIRKQEEARIKKEEQKRIWSILADKDEEEDNWM